MRAANIFRSLAPRFTLAILVVAFVSLSALTIAIIGKFNQGLAFQAQELDRLSSRKLGERLDADARLARARLQRLFSASANELADISRRSEVNAAVTSGNIVAISEALTLGMDSSSLDGIVVVDRHGKVIGANSMSTDIRATNVALAESSLFSGLLGILLVNDRQDPKLLRELHAFRDTGLLAAIGAAAPAAMGEVIAAPMFDDFGEITGALVGHRKLRAEETLMAEFSTLTGLGFVLFGNNEVISQAGIRAGQEVALARYDDTLQVNRTGDTVARCIDYELGTRVCTLLPFTELVALTHEMKRGGEQQGRALIAWILALSAISFCLFGLTAAFVTRAIVGPLSAITLAVLDLARGNWTATVPGLQRSDEVGDIARSIVVLQKSVAERDMLRSESLEQNRRLTWQESKLKLQNLQFTVALENMAEGLCMLDANQRVVVLNDQFRRMFGISLKAELVGLTAFQLKQRIEEDSSRQNFAALARRHLASLANGASAAFTMRLQDDRVISVAHRTMEDGGSVSTFSDITERKRDEARIHYLAQHDPLTDVANRLRLMEMLTLSLNQRGADEIVAVMFLDLDRFKTLNDTLGHGAGDSVLKTVSDRMKRCIGASDTLARFGGDEFVVVHVGARSIVQVEALANRLKECIGAPLAVEGRSIDLGATIGISLAPADDSDPDTLLRKADLALYRAKRHKRGDHLFYDPGMDAVENARRAMELDLRAAVEKDEFTLAYQPIIEAKSLAVNGFEALIRWTHPRRGIISPAEFIPIAEDIGLIGQIGSWVLRRACTDAAAWPSRLSISVNVSPLQIKTGGLELAVMSALGASGIPPSRLHLEITESVFLDNSEQTLATLHNLRAIGVSFSMDDFGTGYSSLSSLRSFPFDTLKIDRSFVRDLAHSADNRHIVRATCQLARDLNFSSLAEGVETREQMEFLIQCGCEQLQGFYFGKPMPLAETQRLLEKDRDVTEFAA